MEKYKWAIGLLAILLIFATSSFLKSRTPTGKTSVVGGWVKIGTQTVSLGVDHDALEIAESAESYNQLKVKVLKAPIHIRNIHIIYEDNTSEGHVITRHFKKGETTRNLDLIGYDRIIKQIIFNYSQRISNQKQPELMVLAKQ